MVAQAMQRAESPGTSVESAEPQPLQEQIASLAYALWQQRGSPVSSSEEDWFRAEQEVLARSEA